MYNVKLKCEMSKTASEMVKLVYSSRKYDIKIKQPETFRIQIALFLSSLI